MFKGTPPKHRANAKMSSQKFSALWPNSRFCLPQCSSPPGQTPIGGTLPQKNPKHSILARGRGREKKEEERRKRKWGRGKEEEEGRKEGRKTAEGRGRKKGIGRGNKEETRRKREEGFPNRLLSQTNIYLLSMQVAISSLRSANKSSECIIINFHMTRTNIQGHLKQQWKQCRWILQHNTFPNQHARPAHTKQTNINANSECASTKHNMWKIWTLQNIKY